MTDDATKARHRALIAATIRTVTAEWLRRKDVPNVGAIGEGLCEVFADEVLDRVHAKDPTTLDVVVAEFTDEWWTRSGDEVSFFEADVERLRREGAPLPADIPDEQLSLLIGGATHMWIRNGDEHHDATAPDGAAHFLLMPFFAERIEAHRAEAAPATRRKA